MPKRTTVDTLEDIETTKMYLDYSMNCYLQDIAHLGHNVYVEEDRTDGFHNARMHKVTEVLQRAVVNFAKDWHELKILEQRNRLTNLQRNRLEVIPAFREYVRSQLTNALKTDDGEKSEA